MFSLCLTLSVHTCMLHTKQNLNLHNMRPRRVRIVPALQIVARQILPAWLYRIYINLEVMVKNGEDH